ncbi:hypothetical protein PC9H_000316 [Pleurotus ostreatus]|uniref:Uncharacterized protein n=2 Tax=Pleurotus ostreatus TaxID=5322 RepID=A0A067P8Q7_PLEO1|nr:uncharacterized protein PC9H_000316 [Pleurotus ostreatus]KAF7439979.1 hypothetical protein PC9H_000316 [Pleurotus ostreatus]KDQ32787.1 hypothetical protein PLEOSDRAFT_1098769 [Pleurotus ostreatus PC15]
MPRCLTLLLRLCGCAPRIDDELADQQKQAQRNSVPKEHDYDVGTPFEPPRRGGYVEYSKRQRRKTRSMTSNFGSSSAKAGALWTEPVNTEEWLDCDCRSAESKKEIGEEANANAEHC